MHSKCHLQIVCHIVSDLDVLNRDNRVCATGLIPLKPRNITAVPGLERKDSWNLPGSSTAQTGNTESRRSSYRVQIEVCFRLRDTILQVSIDCQYRLSYQTFLGITIIYLRNVCQRQVSRAGTSNYIPHILWDVITCPCPWYLLLAQRILQSSLPNPLKPRACVKLRMQMELEQRRQSMHQLHLSGQQFYCLVRCDLN